MIPNSASKQPLRPSGLPRPLSRIPGRARNETKPANSAGYTTIDGLHATFPGMHPKLPKPSPSPKPEAGHTHLSRVPRLVPIVSPNSRDSTHPQCENILSEGDEGGLSARTYTIEVEDTTGIDDEPEPLYASSSAEDVIAKANSSAPSTESTLDQRQSHSRRIPSVEWLDHACEPALTPASDKGIQEQEEPPYTRSSAENISGQLKEKADPNQNLVELGQQQLENVEQSAFAQSSNEELFHEWEGGEGKEVQIEENPTAANGASFLGSSHEIRAIFLQDGFSTEVSPVASGHEIAADDDRSTSNTDSSLVSQYAYSRNVSGRDSMQLLEPEDSIDALLDANVNEEKNSVLLPALGCTSSAPNLAHLNPRSRSPACVRQHASISVPNLVHSINLMARTPQNSQVSFASTFGDEQLDSLGYGDEAESEDEEVADSDDDSDNDGDDNDDDDDDEDQVDQDQDEDDLVQDVVDVIPVDQEPSTEAEAETEADNGNMTEDESSFLQPEPMIPCDVSSLTNYALYYQQPDSIPLHMRFDLDIRSDASLENCAAELHRVEAKSDLIQEIDAQDKFVDMDTDDTVITCKNENDDANMSLTTLYKRKEREWSWRVAEGELLWPYINSLKLEKDFNLEPSPSWSSEDLLLGVSAQGLQNEFEQLMNSNDEKLKGNEQPEEQDESSEVRKEEIQAVEVEKEKKLKLFQCIPMRGQTLENGAIQVDPTSVSCYKTNGSGYFECQARLFNESEFLVAFRIIPAAVLLSPMSSESEVGVIGPKQDLPLSIEYSYSLQPLSQLSIPELKLQISALGVVGVEPTASPEMVTTEAIYKFWDQLDAEEFPACHELDIISLARLKEVVVRKRPKMKAVKSYSEVCVKSWLEGRKGDQRAFHVLYWILVLLILSPAIYFGVMETLASYYRTPLPMIIYPKSRFDFEYYVQPGSRGWWDAVYYARCVGVLISGVAELGYDTVTDLFGT